ncbi:MAG TPA: MoxR family ATPase [Gaiellaceae bacterium]|nr:MoxR family ATPase [Gaiellaceae bacterium]
MNAADFGERCDLIVSEIERAVVGKRDALELVLLGLLADGHVLIEDYPGLAKTLIARSFAQVTSMEFARIQFTPDLMPSDVTGASIFDQRTAEFEFRPGPVFTNLLLADEINRAPPKTQAALLEAMQERQVTSEGVTRPLDRPFLVLATQNPIEYEGTYPLPEAQLDRFLVKVDVGYPEERDEVGMLGLAHRGVMPATLDDVAAVATADELRAVRDQVDATTVAAEIEAYIVAVVRRTRELPSVALGASPRAAVHLLAASKASARISGRDFVTPDDVAWMARPVLRHRLLLRPEAELERYRPDDAVQAALAAVPVPR